MKDCPKMGVVSPGKRQRTFHAYDQRPSSYVCQVHEPQYSSSLMTFSNSLGEETIDFRSEPGLGIFDSGATGSAISAFEPRQLRAEEPEAFTEIDENHRKMFGFGGGAQTLSIGVCTHSH